MANLSGGEPTQTITKGYMYIPNPVFHVNTTVHLATST